MYVIDRISIIRPMVANYSSFSPWSHPPNSRSFSVPLLSSKLNFQDAQLRFPGLSLPLELCFELGIFTPKMTEQRHNNVLHTTATENHICN